MKFEFFSEIFEIRDPSLTIVAAFIAGYAVVISETAYTGQKGEAACFASDNIQITTHTLFRQREEAAGFVFDNT